MKELLSQYQANVHLFEHDADIAPMDCKVEPCPKTTKAILGMSEKRNCVDGCRCKRNGGKCEYALTGGATVCAICGCINQNFP